VDHVCRLVAEAELGQIYWAI